MTRRSALRFALSSALLVTAFASFAGHARARLAIPTGYTLTELAAPQPDGTDRVIQADAWAINASGDVSGDVQAAIGTNHPSYALYWKGGEVKLLGQAGQISAGNDISKGRRVVGFIQRSASDQITPVVWIKNKATPLKTLPGCDGAAFVINAKNRSVGWSATAEKGSTDRTIHACIWSGTTPTDLGALGGDSSAAIAINDNGQIAGWGQGPNGVGAFLLIPAS